MTATIFFVPLVKVDEERQEVWGVAAEEAPDKRSEIMDYAASKPRFEAWSAEIAKASGGKSLGNVRAMHQPIAAGKVIAIDFDDEKRVIRIGAKIVDDNEWKKVAEGVYNGFSVGGNYGKRWPDAENEALTRYEAVPAEISLADNPCMYGATFEVVKAGGETEMRKFEEREFGVRIQRGSPLLRLAEMRKFEERESGDPSGTSAGEPLDKIEERGDVSEADKERAEEEYGDVEFADPVNRKYPIDTEERIRTAWNYIHQEKNREMYSADEMELIESRIIAAWKEAIDEEGPPAAKVEGGSGDSLGVAAAGLAKWEPKTFGVLSVEQELRDVFWRKFWLLEDSAYSILCADELNINQKKAMLAQSVGEFGAWLQEAVAGMSAEGMAMVVEARLTKNGDVAIPLERNSNDLAMPLEQMNKGLDALEVSNRAIETQMMKAMTAFEGRIGEMTKAMGGMEARLKKVEETPVGGGPMLRQVPMPDGGNGVEAEVALLDRMIDEERNPVLKEAMGKRRALLLLKLRGT